MVAREELGGGDRTRRRDGEDLATDVRFGDEVPTAVVVQEAGTGEILHGRLPDRTLEQARG